MPRPGQFLTAMVHEAMASPNDNIYYGQPCGYHLLVPCMHTARFRVGDKVRVKRQCQGSCQPQCHGLGYITRLAVCSCYAVYAHGQTRLTVCILSFTAAGRHVLEASSQNVPIPKRPRVYGQNVPRSVGQNVSKQNVPGADQSFSEYDKMLIKHLHSV